MSDIPKGFTKLPTNSPFNSHIGPYYVRIDKHSEAQSAAQATLPDRLVFGLRVEEKHCNSAGKLHGGMVSGLADVALGHNIGAALRDERPPAMNPKIDGAPLQGMATVNMSIDFVGSATLGDWVEVHVDVQRAGGSLAFANAYLMCGAQRIARVSGVFRIFRQTNKHAG